MTRGRATQVLQRVGIAGLEHQRASTPIRRTAAACRHRPLMQDAHLVLADEPIGHGRKGERLPPVRLTGVIEAMRFNKVQVIESLYLDVAKGYY